MKKIGFIVKVKSKGRNYYYLRRSFWEDNKPKNKSVYSFGNHEKAVETIQHWIESPQAFPDDLKGYGYDLDDAERWLEEIK
ncbi:hypothetical protein [Rossellomorea marisflavi]|uniref:hypothetical protein n=1 Tax=Rossellomorea marisflavi TaxID=189381 RepID=UPI003D2EB6D0